MPLHPALEPLAQTSSNRTVALADVLGAPAEIRDLAHAVMHAARQSHTEPVAPVAEEIDHVIDVDGGEITVRVYRPQLATTLPVHVFFHGGGFWLGTLDHFADVCRVIASASGTAVAAVDYRLAPEARFPTPAEDCYTALRWVVDHAEQLRIDPTRVTVGGGSAGANLAAATTLMARERGGPRLVGQILEVPCTDLRVPPAPARGEEAGGLTPEILELCSSLYLADADDAYHPYASPLLADDLSGLPPALVFVAECDPLRGQGEAYAARLEHAGVDVEVMVGEGQLHGSQHMTKLVPDAVAAYHARIAAFLRRVQSA